MKQCLCIFILSIVSINSSAQNLQLFNLIKNTGKIDRFIFVTTKMPNQDLIELASQARIAKMTMILNGFVDSSSSGLENTKQKIAEINTACCGNNGPSWEIYPQLFEKFNIKEGPSFVISIRNPQSLSDYTKVTGVMSVQNALKFIYSGSLDSQIKADAKSAYKGFDND